MMAFGSEVPDAIRGLLGIEPEQPSPEAPPAWAGRIKDAAYISPSNTRFVFDFENVSRGVTKRTTAFEFAGINEAYVQSNGFGARRYPFRCFFSGDNHDLIATAFEAALLEHGRGRLEHPLYGKFDVVPFGDIERRDDLVDAANQSIVDVTFWTSTGEVYPSFDVEPRSEIEAALNDMYTNSWGQFADRVNVDRAIEKATLKQKVTAALQKVSSTLTDVAEVNAAVMRDFRDIQSSINFGIDTFIGQPLGLAQQLTNMITAPARALAGIRSRLQAYGRLFDSIRNSPGLSGSDQLESVRLQALNSFAVDDHVAMTSVSASVVAILSTTFRSKPEALAAAEAVMAQLAALTQWRDARMAALGIADDGGAYQALRHAVAVVAGYVVQLSNTLLSERRITLTRQRTIIDLAAELYGEVDARLDFLIDTNDLSGDELLELQPGRVIRYYV